MRFSEWNPFRFVEVANSKKKEFVNWFDVFPNGSNRLHCNDSFKPNKSLEYVYKTLRNAIDFQFQSETLYSDFTTELEIKMFDLYGVEVSIDVDFTNITPTGWSSGNGYESYIYNAHVTLTSSYNDFNNPVYIYFKDVADSYPFVSEPFEIHDKLENHIMLKYGHSENDFGMIFYDTTPTEPISYHYKLFVEAELAKNPGGEKSTYTSDRGTLESLRSTPIRSYTVNIPAMPEWLMEKISFICNCDELYVNLVECSTDEGLQYTKLTDYFNGYSGTINLTLVNWDYRDEQTILTSYVLVDSEDEAVIDDNDEVIVN